MQKDSTDDNEKHCMHVIESWFLSYFSQDIPLVLEQRFYWPRMVYLTMRSHVRGWKTKLKY